MKEMVNCWMETMHLAVLDGVQIVYVEKLQPTPAVKIDISRAGAPLPAHCSGVGKVLLAHCEWEYVAEVLKDQGLPALTSKLSLTSTTWQRSSSMCGSAGMPTTTRKLWSACAAWPPLSETRIAM